MDIPKAPNAPKAPSRVPTMTPAELAERLRAKNGKIDPRDISVMFGAPMDEAQFAEYRKNKKFVVLRGDREPGSHK